MMAKKKKGHGGLKFMAFVVVLVVLIVAITKGSKTEMGQRILGNREDRRLEHTSLTPRFSYASARLRITEAHFYNNDGVPVDLTTTSEVSIDRASSRSSTDVTIERTATEVAPGVDGIPFDALNISFTRIRTEEYEYKSPEDEGDAWTRSVNYPYYYGTDLDEHYIPMIDDLMGFELRALPSKPITVEPASGFTRAGLTRPSVNLPTAPSAATTTYSYELDMGTYHRVLPILAARTDLVAPRDTPVTVTIGFDDVGLLRFADVAIASSVATTLSQQLGPQYNAYYHYTIEVTDISGEPINIELPTDVLDEIVPGTVS